MSSTEISEPVVNRSTRPAVKSAPLGGWTELLWNWVVPGLSILLPIVGSVFIGLGLKGREDLKDIAEPASGVTTELGFFETISWFPASWGIAGIISGVLFNILNQQHNKSKLRVLEKKRDVHLTRFNDELASIISVFIELLRSDKDEEASNRFFSSAVREARHLIGHPGTRVCVYQLEMQEVDDTEPKSGERASAETAVWLLVRKAYGGRADPPRVHFTPDTKHGQAVIAIAQGTTAVPISDPAEKDFSIDRNSDAVWCSTLLVPLKYDHDSKGILMIDTREPVDFTAEDISVGWTIANIISLGMGSLVRGGQETKMDVAELQQKLAGLPDDDPVAGTRLMSVDPKAGHSPVVESDIGGGR